MKNTKLKANLLSKELAENEKAIGKNIKQEAKEIEVKLQESQQKLIESVSVEIAKNIVKKA